MVEADKAAQFGSRTILFVDEIHRFNKAQQDAFLPYVERGTIRLIGATTENPSFEINAALLSRCRVYTLVALSEDILTLLERAVLTLSNTPNVPHSSTVSSSMSGSTKAPEPHLQSPALQATPEALLAIATYASGDARTALNALEIAAQLALSKSAVILSEARSAKSKDTEEVDVTHTARTTTPDPALITQELAAEALQRRTLLYDKKGEQHYDIISALHKSVRNSDPDAALYWLGRMLEAGEDPMYVARRIVRMAVEDIGLAAPEALNLCLSARDAMHFLGHPEGDLALAQAVVYLALAPKSNAIYTAFAAARQDIATAVAQPVPLHLRNAPTKLMKSLDYGKDYQYAHDLEGRVADMQCLPDNLKDRRYYHPTNEGRERQLAQRMEDLANLKQSKRP